MDKPTFVYMLIEAVVFLSAFAVVFIKLGGYKKVVEDIDSKTKTFPEWKASVDTKITQLELNDLNQNATLVEINKNITAISTKMDLLLDNRIKMEK